MSQPPHSAAAIDALPVPPRVLVIDDDPVLADALATYLARFAMLVECAGTLAAGRESKERFRPDVVIVDIHLPDGSGKQLVQEFSDGGDCGVIIMSGDIDLTDRIVGLELGADDYLCKPPEPRELVARVQALHRRLRSLPAKGEPAAEPAAPAPAAPGKVHLLEIGPVRIDLQLRRAVGQHDEPLHFTGAEYALLEALSATPGVVISRDALTRTILGRLWTGQDRSIDQLVYHVRQKLVAAGADVQAVQAVRAAGYVLRLAEPLE